MNKNIALAASCCSIIFFAGCGTKPKDAATTATGPVKDTSRQALLQNVKALETKVYSSQTFEPATDNLAISAYADFAKYFPADTLSAGFIFNAASLASNIGQTSRAIAFYEQVVSKYPQSKVVPQAIFGEAFVYDYKLKDTANAHKKYAELLTKFPHDTLASNARISIKLLGKSDDEIIKSFEEQNKQKEKAEHKKTRT